MEADDDAEVGVASGWPRLARAALSIAVVVVVILGGGLAFVATSWRRDVEASDAARADLAIELRDARSDVERLERTVAGINAAHATAERRQDDAARSVTIDEFVMREPILVAPPGPPACAARDLELVGDASVGFLRFFNRSGRPCVLLDHPTLQGRDDGGVWRTIPVLDSLGSSYTDGPAWTGTFDPRFVAVLSVRPHDVLPELGHCLTGEATPATFEPLRLVLRGQALPVSLPGSRFDLGGCRPTLLLWAYDSTDE